MDLILSKDAEKFISKLASKQSKQIVIKIMELRNSGITHDSIKLKGSYDAIYYRADVGEFRIIYQIEEDSLQILCVGKRNDDEIYNRFKRKFNK